MIMIIYYTVIMITQTVRLLTVTSPTSHELAGEPELSGQKLSTFFSLSISSVVNGTSGYRIGGSSALPLVIRASRWNARCAPRTFCGVINQSRSSSPLT